MTKGEWCNNSVHSPFALHLADAAGTITKNYLYDAFGNEQTEDAADTNPFRYSGEYFDAESGNIYLRNRYYDASTGRFITEDPIQDGTNWYVYAGNNPVLFIDPFGLWEPGDENRSDGAQIYIKYYTEKWQYFDASYQNATNDFVRIISAVGREISHQMADDIRRLDEEGKIEGAQLAVPTYDQFDIPNGSNLCWATCASMWISYILGDTIDRKLDIAIVVAKDMVAQGREQLNPDGSLNYNVPREWISTDYIAGLLGLSGVTASQTQRAGNLSMDEIKGTINVNSPFAVLYGNYDSNNIWSGHWILGIGYAIAPGHNPLVVSNDPAGGVQRIQTYDEFNDPYVGEASPWRPWAETAK